MNNTNEILRNTSRVRTLPSSFGLDKREPHSNGSSSRERSSAFVPYVLTLDGFVPIEAMLNKARKQVISTAQTFWVVDSFVSHCELFA